MERQVHSTRRGDRRALCLHVVPGRHVLSSHAVIVATISSIFIVLGAITTPNTEHIPVWMIATNRALSIFIIWVSLFFLLQRRRDLKALQRAHGELEVRVQERTAELATVNKALVIEITERMETESSLRISEAAFAASQRALQRSEEDLRGLAARLLTAQEEERRRISRDLHDDINQRLAMMVVELETLDRLLPTDCQHIGTRLRSLQDNATELSDDVRHLSYTYHPAVLDDLGLEVALKRLVDDFSIRTGLQGVFQGRPRVDHFRKPWPPVSTGSRKKVSATW